MNDSKATNVAAAVAAIESFDADVHALMGGSLKGGDFELLADPVARRCAAVYLTGPAADPIAAALEPTGVELDPLHKSGGRPDPRRGSGRRGFHRSARPGVRQLRRLLGLRGAWRPLPKPREGVGGGVSAKTRKPPAKPKVKPKVTGRSKPAAKRKSPYPIEHSILLTTTLCLLALGVVMVFSASSTTSLLGDAGDGAFYLKRTALFGIFGLIALRLLSVNGVNMLRPLTVPLMGLSIVLLIAVMIPGVGIEVNGAKRWLGAGLFQIQPSEIAKVALILYGAQPLGHAAEHDALDLGTWGRSSWPSG